MKSSITICLLSLSLILIGCAKQDFSTTDYHNVERILMHERGKYTFFIRNDETQEFKILTVQLPNKKEKVFTDVPKNESCWIRVGAPWDNNNRFSLSLEIHVHNAKEIDGAGWYHGKFGQGKTTVVE